MACSKTSSKVIASPLRLCTPSTHPRQGDLQVRRPAASCVFALAHRGAWHPGRKHGSELLRRDLQKSAYVRIYNARLASLLCNLLPGLNVIRGGSQEETWRVSKAFPNVKPAWLLG